MTGLYFYAFFQPRVFCAGLFAARKVSTDDKRSEKIRRSINFVYFNLRNKTQSLQLPGVLYASGNEVDAGGLNAGVAQYIRQFGYIPAGPVESPGEQVPQVVGEYFRGGHAGLFA